MTKDEALRLALEALEGVLDDSPKVMEASISGGLYEVVQCRDAITAIKAALEANEFNPDWDTQAVLTEEIQRMAKRIEELEANDKPYALEASMFSNDRVKVDPVTGNVSIGTPQRTWVGLTDMDIALIDWESLVTRKDCVRAIEAKLKEKNT